jgi:glutamine amidotransferase PdxT
MEVVEVWKLKLLAGLVDFIIPNTESTTMAKLVEKNKLMCEAFFFLLTLSPIEYCIIKL